MSYDGSEKNEKHTPRPTFDRKNRLTGRASGQRKNLESNFRGSDHGEGSGSVDRNTERNTDRNYGERSFDDKKGSDRFGDKDIRKSGRFEKFGEKENRQPRDEMFSEKDKYQKSGAEQKEPDSRDSRDLRDLRDQRDPRDGRDTRVHRPNERGSKEKRQVSSYSVFSEAYWYRGGRKLKGSND